MSDTVCDRCDLPDSDGDGLSLCSVCTLIEAEAGFDLADRPMFLAAVRLLRKSQQHAPDVVFVLTLKDAGVVEVWQREGRRGDELAEMLRRIADGFESGDVKRIR